MRKFTIYDKKGFLAYKDLKDYKWKATEFSDIGIGDRRIFHETGEKVYACVMENRNKYYLVFDSLEKAEEYAKSQNLGLKSSERCEEYLTEVYSRYVTSEE